MAHFLVQPFGRSASKSAVLPIVEPQGFSTHFQILAEREGFEPSIRDYRIHTFQACSFSHSDTSPKPFSDQGLTLKSVGRQGYPSPLYL